MCKAVRILMGYGIWGGGKEDKKGLMLSEKMI